MTKNAYKMRVKTHHGHKRGALRVIGRPNLPLKGSQGTLFGQIWFAFGFIGLKRAQKESKCTQKGSKASNYVKVSQNTFWGSIIGGAKTL